MDAVRRTHPSGCGRGRPWVRWLGVVLAAVVALAGCTRADQADLPGAAGSDSLSSGASGAEAFNDADVEFLQDMIPRDQQAIAMAELVSGRTDRAELVAFDTTVADARAGEIGAMRTLLADAGHDAPGGDGGEEPEQLAGLRGEQFDRAFLDLLKAHGQEAIQASERVLEQGANPAVADLAARIIGTRQGELAQLEYWGHQWNLLESVPPAGLGPGDRGPQVLALEQRLDSLRFDVGQVDEVYDANTLHAVVAFQKLTGAPPSGRASPDVVDRLASAQPPPPLVPGGGATRVEVDLPRQVLFLYQDDQLFRILPVSTGSGKRFCVEGECGDAVTPPGAFRVAWRVSGWRTSRLGRLFNPLYFHDDGIAIHGYPTVPPQPASHGCVRIPMSSAAWFPERVPDGTPVYVLDGKTPVGPIALALPS